MTNRLQVKTALNIHPEWELSKQEAYVYQYHLLKLPDLKENQLSISGIKIEQFEDFAAVTAFIRSSLNKSIKLDMLQLLILDEQNGIIARETFDMERFGELPAESARPWKFIFEKDVIKGDLPATGWSIAFELKKNETHTIEHNESWSDAQNHKLRDLLKDAPPVNPNEVNIMGVDIRSNDAAELVVTLLIRNGSHQNLQFEQLPLIVEDAASDVIAKGVFSLSNFEVKANTSKPWTFIFTNELVMKQSPDLSTWKVYPPQ